MQIDWDDRVAVAQYMLDNKFYSTENQKEHYEKILNKYKPRTAIKNAIEPPPAPAPKEEEYGEDQKTWVHKGKAYIRVYNYLWDAKTGDWVGEWDPVSKTINTKAIEPETE